VGRRAIAALVIGPAGLAVINMVDAGPDDHAAASIQAVRAFLAEEFPALHLPVRHLFAAPSGAQVTRWAGAQSLA